MTLIDEHGIKRVCDVGGGANPLFGETYVGKQGISYSVLDISSVELAKASVHCEKITADIAAPDFSLDRQFELVFSKMLAEHIPDAGQFHRNVFKILAPKGIAIHFFPTLYTLPFLANYLLPERLGDFLLTVFAPARDRYRYAKFPAYYRWCRGPTRSQILALEGLGYEVVEYRGYFGHSGYYNSFGALRKLHEFKTRYLLRHPFPLLTSFACIVLRKP
jgi:2-polyprenyl-3-methyl-5-hydroxy-6-metoxy-1,4-benzoquinol methylase